MKRLLCDANAAHSQFSYKALVLLAFIQAYHATGTKFQSHRPIA